MTWTEFVAKPNDEKDLFVRGKVLFNEAFDITYENLEYGKEYASFDEVTFSRMLNGIPIYQKEHKVVFSTALDAIVCSFCNDIE